MRSFSRLKTAMNFTVFEYLGMFGAGLIVIGLVAASSAVVRFYSRKGCHDQGQ